MKKKKIIITAGGTGGHVYPAISLAQKLQREVEALDILFIGGKLSDNRYFKQTEFAHKSVSCGTFTGKSPVALLKSTTKICQGTWQSRQIIKAFNPILVVGFGSYYTLPTLMAARLASIPIVLHEANSMPGKVNRLFSKYAEVTGIHFPVTAQFLSGKTAEVGMPLREGYNQSCCSSAEAKEYFGLNGLKPTLLIFGGSQGAKGVNRLLSEEFVKKISFLEAQIIHLTGDTAAANAASDIYRKAGIQASVKSYEEKMQFAWKAADLVISRAGAGTIAEELEFEVPGILIPYPFAADNHQELNADFIANVVGGGIRCSESQLTPELLADRVLSFFRNDREMLRKMQDAMKLYKKNARALHLCDLVKKFIV